VNLEIKITLNLIIISVSTSYDVGSNQFFLKKNQ